MTQYDLAIQGRFFSGALREGWIYVKDGRIASVRNSELGGYSKKVVLSPDEFLLPAATDLHVHLRDWSQASKETVESGTRAALAGGVTTVADMPNTEPRVASANAVRERVALLAEKSYVDFAIHAGVPEDLAEMRGMRSSGAFAVKFYSQDLPRFKEASREARMAGLKVAVHAEREAAIGTRQEPKAEILAVRDILAEMGARSEVRFAHVSTPEAVREIQHARKKGASIEVTPHHLFMDAGTARERVGPASAVRPPLRSKSDVRRMVDLMEEGAFRFYATDHAPHTAAEKVSQTPSPGFTGLEVALPLFLTRTKDLALVCRMFCENPAAYLGTKKGVIAPGYDADLVIVSNETWKVDPSRFFSHGKCTPFQGETLRYRVRSTIMRGTVVYDSAGFNRVVTRPVKPVT